MDNKPISAETSQMGAEAQLNEGMSVVPSNNGGRIHRLGFIEIIDDDTEKVEIDTEGMTPEELDDLRIWEIEKAADEGRLIIHEIDLTEEDAARLGISFCYTGERVALRHGIQIPSSLQGESSTTNEKKGWRSLRPASRPNKKNKGYTRYNNY